MKATSTSTSAINPDVHVVHDDVSALRAEWAAEKRAAQALLREFNLNEADFAPELWDQFKSQAERVQFLAKPNRYQVDGAVAEHLLVHIVNAPTQAAAERFVAAVHAELPALSRCQARTPTETLPDRIVYIRQVTFMEPRGVFKDVGAIVRVAHESNCEYQHWSPNDDYPESTPDAATLSANERRLLSMRTEFPGDALLARSILAPYVLRWTDYDSNIEFAKLGGDFLPVGLDQEVEMELAESAPELDHLRWLLGQATDLHVAAESLNYTACYTGERLDYRLMELLSPPADIRITMQSRFKALQEALHANESRLADVFAALDIDPEVAYQYDES